MIRSFIAIDLPDPARAVLEEAQNHLRLGRLNDPETFHVTLAFLDKQSEATLEAVHEALTRLSVPSFDLTIQGVDCFGGAVPRVLWAGVAPSSELTLLRDRVRGAVSQARIKLPRERYRPHVTLARFRRFQDGEFDRLARFLSDHATLVIPPFRVTHFHLYESTLHPDGAEHTPLASYALV